MVTLVRGCPFHLLQPGRPGAGSEPVLRYDKPVVYKNRNGARDSWFFCPRWLRYAFRSGDPLLILDDTLVLWGGEFGRMPMSEQGTGRDHNPWGYSVWMAGGGVKGGIAYGATDDVGLRAAVDKVHVHDLHATILRLLGFNHEWLTYGHNGRDERLTDVAGRVVWDVIA